MRFLLEPIEGKCRSVRLVNIFARFTSLHSKFSFLSINIELSTFQYKCFCFLFWKKKTNFSVDNPINRHSQVTHIQTLNNYDTICSLFEFPSVRGVAKNPIILCRICRIRSVLTNSNWYQGNFYGKNVFYSPFFLILNQNKLQYFCCLHSVGYGFSFLFLLLIGSLIRHHPTRNRFFFPVSSACHSMLYRTVPYIRWNLSMRYIQTHSYTHARETQTHTHTHIARVNPILLASQSYKCLTQRTGIYTSYSCITVDTTNNNMAFVNEMSWFAMRCDVFDSMFFYAENSNWRHFLKSRRVVLIWILLFRGS